MKEIWAGYWFGCGVVGFTVNLILLCWAVLVVFDAMVS